MRHAVASGQLGATSFTRHNPLKPQKYAMSKLITQDSVTHTNTGAKILKDTHLSLKRSDSSDVANLQTPETDTAMTTISCQRKASFTTKMELEIH